jgi:CRISPR/Cas system-associated protein Csx1
VKTQAFISVFKVRIDKLKNSIKLELQKTKSERRRETLKSWIKDIKRLQKVIDEAKRENTCPHCGGELD